MVRFVFIVFLILPYIAFPQVRINGRVMEMGSFEPVPFATCHDTVSNASVLTDESGRFSITVPSGPVAISVKFAGTTHGPEIFMVKRDTAISLIVSPQQIESVTIIAHEEPIHLQAVPGRTHVPVRKIEAIPSMAGQTDVLKALLYLPGVSSGRGGRSDMHVRGGSRDQNLLLMDNAVVYNPYHTLGFLTGINTDVVRSVDFYKGGFPARYGGRASSILDIQLKDGHKTQWHGKFSLGVVSSGLTLEGPLVRERTSLIVALRSSYLDLIMHERNKAHSIRTRKDFLSDPQNGYTMAFAFRFYDLNLKVSHDLSRRSKVSLNFYTGRDYRLVDDREITSRESYDSKTEMTSRNHTASLGINTNIGSRSYLLNTLSFSGFPNRFESNMDFVDRDSSRTITIHNTETWISDITFKSQLVTDYSNAHSQRIGVEGTRHFYQPDKMFYSRELQPEATKHDTTYQGSVTGYLDVFSGFIEETLRFGEGSHLNVGLRASIANAMGKPYFRAEPRLSLMQLLNSNLSIKASYTLMHQFLHVITDTFSDEYMNLWVGSTRRVPPSSAHQVTLGVFGLEPITGMEFSLEPFYKRMYNLTYFQGVNREEGTFSPWEDNMITDGAGEVYGAELFLQKRTNAISTSLSYTLSWNNRRFSELNNGEWFPFLYDRRHDISIIFLVDLSKEYSAGINFTYNTGARWNLPQGGVPAGRFFPKYDIYGPMNSTSLPPYHRLDLMTQRHWEGKGGLTHKFEFNVYNAYARKNAESIYIANGKIYKRTTFTIIPSFTYGIIF